MCQRLLVSQTSVLTIRIRFGAYFKLTKTVYSDIKAADMFNLILHWSLSVAQEIVLQEGPSNINANITLLLTICHKFLNSIKRFHVMNTDFFHCH